MTAFPSLKPNTRSIELGDAPQLEFQGVSGATVRFLMGTNRITQTLSLTYNSITEAEYYLIFNHYEGQDGGFLAFALPAVIWEGYSTVPISAVDYDWRYAGPIEITPTVPGRFEVTVQLESVII